jgi:protein subunit release factor B
MSSYAVQITSGVGPDEARRFVAALAEYLAQLAVARGLGFDEAACHGDAAEPRSVTLYLRGEVRELFADQLGTHVLVHRSVARGRAARKRWFAAVSLHDGVLGTGAIAPELARQDLEITACRAGGPGGQHVNKVATAIRVRHLPTGLAVRCASARSQKANLDQAMRRLAVLLAERDEAARERAVRERRGAHYRVERGRAAHSYTLVADGALVEMPGGRGPVES